MLATFIFLPEEFIQVVVVPPRRMIRRPVSVFHSFLQYIGEKLETCLHERGCSST